MDQFTILIFYILVLLFSVVIHEVSHGIVALWQGDPTAKFTGRLTLNPIPHIDLFGTIIVPLFLMIPALFGTPGPIFGWAKPVPYNPYNLRNQKWGAAMVSLAGPASNFVIAVVFGIALRFFPATTDVVFVENLARLLVIIVRLNILLGIFNLVPIPPLDGSKLLFSVLPSHMSHIQMFLERYGFIILLFFIFFAFKIIFPLVASIFSLITGMAPS